MSTAEIKMEAILIKDKLNNCTERQKDIFQFNDWPMSMSISERFNKTIELDEKLNKMSEADVKQIINHIQNKKNNKSYETFGLHTIGGLVSLIGIIVMFSNIAIGFLLTMVGFSSTLNSQTLN